MYSLGLIELEILKTSIKINLTNDFIWLFKSLAKAFILFNRKLNKSLCFYIDYWDLHNITIKNRYLLPLISKLLDWLGWAKRVIPLDLTNAYYRMRIHKNNE